MQLRSSFNGFFLTLLGLTTLLVLPGIASSRSSLDRLEEGDPAPALSIEQWHNVEKPLDLKSLRGEVVLLDFWGVWCAPCKKAIPTLKDLATEFEDEPFRIIMVHTPMKSDEIESFRKKHKLELPIAVDRNGNRNSAQGDTSRAYGVTGFPSYWLIDKAGDVRVLNAHKTPSSDAIRALLDE